MLPLGGLGTGCMCSRALARSTLLVGLGSRLRALPAGCLPASLPATHNRDELKALFRVDPGVQCDTHAAIKCT